ncbi:MAG TPA: DUF4255 domain-containing protein [Methylothermaceae bacterium]|nr:DUF4255 domain-containing protein [Methylothermaceae bacterium]
MSNYLAIATVTAALRNLLQSAVQAELPGAGVTTLRPDKSGEEEANPTLNLYLYQVTPNSAWRNEDLPTRDSANRLVQKPRAALDLHYLLSFYGKEGELIPQRLLGIVVRTLHARPVLRRKAIEAVVRGTSYLANSDLAREVETIKFTPLPLNLEELSKLWSVFFQTPYVLSVAYQAGVVFIESEETPRTPLPVRRRNLYVRPLRQPLIETVDSETGDPIVAGSTLVIRGRQLRGDDTRVRIAGTEVPPSEVTDTQLRVKLPDTLRAGVQGIQVIHRQYLGTPPTPHRGFESNVVPFVLHPTITNIQIIDTTGTGDQPRSAKVTVNPAIGRRQRVLLLLNGSDGGAEAYTLPAEPLDTDTITITITIPEVKAGEYLARLQVDGAESLLEVDDEGRYTNPTVMIP